MELKFGKGVMEMHALDITTYLQMLPPTHPLAQGISPVKIYAWSCKDDAGTPAHPPKAIRLDADIKTFKADPISMHGPTISGWQERNSVQNLAQGSGFSSMKEVQKELDRLFPPLEIDVPYDKLIEPFKFVDCMDLYAQQIYLAWEARFTGLAEPVGSMIFYLRIPLAVRFFTIVTDVCEGFLDEKYMTGGDVTIRLKQGETAKKLIEEHKKDIEKQREMSKRWDETKESFRDE